MILPTYTYIHTYLDTCWQTHTIHTPHTHQVDAPVRNKTKKTSSSGNSELRGKNGVVVDTDIVKGSRKELGFGAVLQEIDEEEESSKDSSGSSGEEEEEGDEEEEKEESSAISTKTEEGKKRKKNKINVSSKKGKKRA